MHKPMPPLNALRAFEVAARHLSLTKAAQELHVTAGALSTRSAGSKRCSVSSCSNGVCDR